MKQKFRQRVMRVTVVIAMAVSGMVLANAPAHAAGPSRVFTLSNASSGRCMAIGAGSKAGGAGVIQFACDGKVEQDWYANGPWYPDGDGVPYYQIVNNNSNMCLADPGDNPNNNVQLIQYGCDGGPEQLWYLGQGNMALRRYHSDQCAADGGSSYHDGAPIVQWTCDYLAEQNWTLVYNN